MAEKIPYEILIDILSRLPVKDLFRFKLVCREWLNMIDDPCLPFMQLKYASKHPDSILCIDGQDKCSTTYARFRYLNIKDDLSSKFNLVADFLNCSFLVNSCNGLLCVQYYISEIDYSRASHRKYNIYICNPLKKEVVMVLPHQGIVGYGHYGFGVESMTHTYKVVRILNNHISERCQVEVHTLGTNSWRKTESTQPAAYLYESPVSAHGALFWAATLPNSSLDCYIASFDMTTEVLNITRRPNFYRCSDLFILKGDVAILNYASRTRLEIWLFKGEKLDCVKEFTIDVKIRCERYSPLIIGMWDYDEMLLHARSKDLADKKKSDLYYSYNTTTKQVRSIQVPFEDNTKYCSYSRLICFRGSMLSPFSLNGNTRGEDQVK